MRETGDGGLAPAQEADTPTGAGAWIAVSQRQLAIPAKATAAVPFTVTVPIGTLPGDQLGAVVVAVRAGRSSTGLSVETRAALTARVRVVGDVRPSFKVGRLARESGGVERFSVAVTNTGNVLLTLKGVITLDGGREDVPIETEAIYLIPGGSATVRATWSDPPTFGRVRAQARVSAFAGGEEVGEKRSNTLVLTFVDTATLAGASAAAAAGGAAWVGTRGIRMRRRVRRREEREVIRNFRAGR